FSSLLFVFFPLLLLDLHSFPTRRSSDLPPYEINRFRCRPSSKSDNRFKFFCSSSVMKSVSFTGYFAVSSIADCIASLPLFFGFRSEEHTSELQSRFDLVCRLLLEKKKNI